MFMDYARLIRLCFGENMQNDSVSNVSSIAELKVMILDIENQKTFNPNSKIGLFVSEIKKYLEVQGDLEDITTLNGLLDSRLDSIKEDLKISIVQSSLDPLKKELEKELTKPLDVAIDLKLKSLKGEIIKEVLESLEVPKPKKKAKILGLIPVTID